MDDLFGLPDPDNPDYVVIELLRTESLPDPVKLRHQLEPDELDRLRELAKAAAQRSVEIVELALQAKLARLGPRPVD